MTIIDRLWVLPRLASKNSICYTKKPQIIKGIVPFDEARLHPKKIRTDLPCKDIN